MTERREKFTGLDRWVQRVMIASGRSLHPLVRLGGRWVKTGWRLSRQEYETRAFRQLFQTISHFRKLDLLPWWPAKLPVIPESHSGLRNLPILTREGLQQFYPQLEAMYGGRHSVQEIYSGGSTGQPTRFFHGPYQRFVELGLLWELLAVVGWRPGLPRVCLWGAPRITKPCASANLLCRAKLFADIISMEPGPKEFKKILSLIEENAPCAFYGFPSAHADLLEWIQATGVSVPKGAVVCAWSTAETILPGLPESFREVFGCSLRNLYGSAETPGLAVECEQGTLHANSRYLFEAVSPTSLEPLPLGQSGNLLITDLLGNTTPFLRYRIGDVGALGWCECPCGRSGYSITLLAGRESEQLVLASGRRINSIQFNVPMNDQKNVRHFMMVRYGLRHFEMRYVGEEFAADTERELLEQYRIDLEGAEISFKRVESLPLARSGKFIRYQDLSEESAN